MADPTPTSIPAAPTKPSFWHIVLGVLALGAAFMSRIPKLAAWGDLLVGAAGLLGIGSVAAALAVLPPWARPIVQMFLQGIPPATPTTAGTIIAKQAAKALLPVLFFGAMLSGCLPSLAACKIVPQTVAVEAKCTLENNLIACGEKSGLDLVPIVADVVMSAIGGTLDSATLVAELESEGLGTSAPCILAAVEGYLMPVAPQIAAKVHEALAFKLKKDGHHGAVDVKTKSGYVAHVVLA